MFVSNILEDFDGTLIHGTEEQAQTYAVFNAVCNNHHATMGSAFFAIRSSAKRDPETGALTLAADHRAKYARDAVKRGAQVIVASPSFDPDEMGLDVFEASKVMVVHVDRPGHVFATLDAMLRPISPRLRFAGVTGTNGKSSTVAILRDVLRHAGRVAFSGGTLGVIGRAPLSDVTSVLTTPEARAAHDIYNTLADHHGAEILALEVSSQGLMEGRLAAIEFKVAAFTNFTRDHLDTHSYDPIAERIDETGAEARYLTCKLSLFTENLADNATVILNRDMDRFPEVYDHIRENRSTGKIITFGTTPDATLRVQTLHPILTGQRIAITYRGERREVDLPLFGSFQAENAGLAVAMAVAFDVQPEVAVEGLANVQPVPGRMQLIGMNAAQGRVFVDYAHTSDAVARVVAAGRDLAGDAPLSVMLGCGGDRDAGKRALMGRATRGADQVYVTDDNPRTEDPASLRAAVRDGAAEAGVVHIHDVAGREYAIARAIAELPANGVLLLCGKGHEDYQEIVDLQDRSKTVKIPFSDAETARSILREKVAEPERVSGMNGYRAGVSETLASIATETGPRLRSTIP